MQAPQEEALVGKASRAAFGFYSQEARPLTGTHTRTVHSAGNDDDNSRKAGTYHGALTMCGTLCIHGPI